MENYNVKVCPYCNTEIREGDDIKVCPACGVEHHWNCWLANKGCTTPGCTEQYVDFQRTVPQEPAYQQPAYQAPAYQQPAYQAPAYQEPVYQPQPAAPAYAAPAYAPYPTTAPAPAPAANKCAILAIIFGAIGMIPFLNFVFLPVALVLGIVGLATSKGKKKGAMIASIIVLVISLIISIAWMSAEFGKEDFNDKYSYLGYNTWCYISEDGETMTIDSNPYDEDDYYEFGISDSAYEYVKQINTELGFDSSVYDDMMETCWNDGTQYRYAGDYTVSWTYHPDKGLEVTYTIN